MRRKSIIIEDEIDDRVTELLHQKNRQRPRDKGSKRFSFSKYAAEAVTEKVERDTGAAA